MADTPSSVEEVRALVDELGIEFVFAQFVEMHGKPNAKLVPASHLEDVFAEGAGFAGFAAGEIWQGPHDPDLAAMPDPASFTQVPWQPELARFACDVFVEGEPWPYCPRTILRRQLDRAKDMGFVFKTGMEAEFFLVKRGPDGRITVADDLDSAIGALTEAGLKGHGLVVTTGGTGAESKDCVVEAIQALDPTAATPYVVHYHRGQGRHAKDGVRLAVGCVELTTYVALTGPHREVRLVAPVMVRGLKLGMSNDQLAEEMANLLRADLTDRHGAIASN